MSTTQLDPRADDAVAAPPHQARHGHTRTGHGEHRWWALAVIGLAQLMVVLDSTIVNIALPSAPPCSTPWPPPPPPTTC